MLKELFVIGYGIPFFHYSSLEVSADDIVLSSGLLSAIKDFSESTRSDNVDSFSTDTEFFLFHKLEKGKALVGVFDRKVPDQLARETLKRISVLIARTSILEEDVPDSTHPDKEPLHKEITQFLSQFFGLEGQGLFIQDLLQQRSDVPLAFLVDIEQKKVLSHFARPKPLFKEEQVREFFLLFSTLGKSLFTLNLPLSYSYFTISSQDYFVASCWSGRVISIASSTLQSSEKEIKDVAAQMCYYSSLEDLITLPSQSSISTKSSLLKNGTIIHEKGEPLPSTSAISLSVLINNVNSFFKLLTRRSFNRFEVILSKEHIKGLVLERVDSSEDFSLILFQYS